jgi:hypothetical protein
MTNGNRSQGSQLRTGLEWGVPITTALVLLVELVLLTIHWRQTNSVDFHPKLIGFNQAIKSAFEAELNHSHTILAYAIVMLGTLWGLVILKGKEVVITAADRPELILFCCANVVFALFLCTNYWYTESLIDALLFAGGRPENDVYIPDPSIWEIRELFWIQVFNLAFFLLVGAAGLFSAHKLKVS